MKKIKLRTSFLSSVSYIVNSHFNFIPCFCCLSICALKVEKSSHIAKLRVHVHLPKFCEFTSVKSHKVCFCFVTASNMGVTRKFSSEAHDCLSYTTAEIGQNYPVGEVPSRHQQYKI